MLKNIIIPGLAAGLVMFFAMLAVSMVINVAFPQFVAEYGNAALYRQMNDPLMWAMFLQPLFVGLVLAWVWDEAKGSFKKMNWIKKSVEFGLFYFVIVMPGMFMTYTTFPVSLEIMLSWTVSVFVQAMLGSLVLTKLNN